MKTLIHALLLATALIGSMEMVCCAATLRIASTLSKPLTETILQGYQNTTGIIPEVTYVVPGTLIDRLSGLYRKKIDCLLGPNQEELYMANHFNMLLPYSSEQLYEVPQELHVKKNCWTYIWVDYIAFLSNKNRLKKLGIYAPDGWLELLNPQLRDDIVVGEYEISRTTYASIISLWQMQGESRSLHYAHEWNRHKVKFVRFDEDAIDEVTKGKRALTIIPLSVALNLEKENPDLYVTIPQDANKHLYIGAAIMKSTQQEQLAQQFIDYLLTDRFINYMDMVSPYPLWHVKRFEEDEKRKAIIGDTKIATDDLGWSTLTKKEIIKQWKKA